VSPEPDADLTDDELDRELCRLYVDDHMTLVDIGRRYGHSADWARRRIHCAGVTIRTTTFKPEIVPAALVAEMARLYIVDGNTMAEIADRVGRNRSWVSTQLEAADVQLKPGGSRRLNLNEAWIIDQYVEHRRPMSSIANDLGVNGTVVKRVLADHDIDIRSKSESITRIDGDELRRMYRDQQMTTGAIAEQLGMSTSGVGAALHRHNIPTRERGGELTISRQQLQAHLDNDLSNAEIAAMHDVSVNGVTRRLRDDKMRRRPRSPTTRPTPPRLTLHNLYVDQEMSLADIAARYEVPHATVRRWLDHNGIERRARAYTTNPTGNVLDHDTIKYFYVTEEWTAAEIGRHVGVTKKIILDHLHRYGVPLRPPGAKRPATDRALLDRLYSDQTVVAVLHQHDVPVVPTPGRLRRRFADPAPLAAGLIERLYTELGLSVSQISLITGHFDLGVRAALQQAGIEARSGAVRAPWTIRNST